MLRSTEPPRARAECVTLQGAGKVHNPAREARRVPERRPGLHSSRACSSQAPCSRASASAREGVFGEGTPEPGGGRGFRDRGLLRPAPWRRLLHDVRLVLCPRELVGLCRSREDEMSVPQLIGSSPLQYSNRFYRRFPPRRTGRTCWKMQRRATPSSRCGRRCRTTATGTCPSRPSRPWGRRRVPPRRHVSPPQPAQVFRWRPPEPPPPPPLLPRRRPSRPPPRIWPQRTPTRPSASPARSPAPTSAPPPPSRWPPLPPLPSSLPGPPHKPPSPFLQQPP